MKIEILIDDTPATVLPIENQPVQIFAGGPGHWTEWTEAAWDRYVKDLFGTEGMGLLAGKDRENAELRGKLTEALDEGEQLRELLQAEKTALLDARKACKQMREERDEAVGWAKNNSYAAQLAQLRREYATMQQGLISQVEGEKQRREWYQQQAYVYNEHAGRLADVLEDVFRRFRTPMYGSIAGVPATVNPSMTATVLADEMREWLEQAAREPAKPEPACEGGC